MNPEYLHVYREGRLVGRLWKEGPFNLLFQYDKAWLDDASAPALSLALPKDRESPKPRPATAFFSNLCYEGQSRRELARSNNLPASHLPFALLAKFGQDTAGALVIQPGNAPPPSMKQHYAEVTGELMAILAQGTKRRHSLPLALESSGHKLNFSIAGAQDKIAVHRQGSRFFIPAANTYAPTTWVLKPDHKDFPCIPENELFCLELARAAGFPVPAVEILKAENEPFFLIQRYDRHIGPDGRIRRLHQEDFCQALHLPPERKYQTNNGPGFVEAGRLLSRLAEAEKSLDDFVRLALFNFLIGNADAHGKNFSLLYAQDSEAGLSPAYDLLSTQIYDEISPHFAMSYGQETKPSAIGLEVWKNFARHLKLAEARLSSAMLGLINPVAKCYEPRLETVLRQHPRFTEKAERLRDLIKNRLAVMEKAAEALARPGGTAGAAAP